MIEKYIARIYWQIASRLPSSRRREKLKKQAKHSAVVGGIATIIDFTLLNSVVLLLGVVPLLANIISMTVATTFSYILNRRVVFSGGETSKRKTIAPYLIVTVVGLYGIQSVVIGLVIHYGPALGEMAAMFLSSVFSSVPSADTLLLNIAKFIAASIAGVWNFVLYRRLVFKDR